MVSCDDEHVFEKRLSVAVVTLLRICSTTSMATTMVLPEPVAILEAEAREFAAVAGDVYTDLL